MSTTGHSLGEYLALYVAAENGYKNVGFNGPDPYHILSSEAKKWVKNNQGMLMNYSNKYDFIGNLNGDETGSRIVVNTGFGLDTKSSTNPLNWRYDSHSLSTWEFDEEGNIHTDNIKENEKLHQAREEKLLDRNMSELSMFAKQLMGDMRTLGGLSSNEEIFLNNSQALIAVEYLMASIEIGLETVVELYEEAIKKTEDIWEEGLQLAKSISTELSDNEIIEALETGGVTKRSIVFDPSAYYRERIRNALSIEESFHRLASEIKESIAELMEEDEKLGVKIYQGALVDG